MIRLLLLVEAAIAVVMSLEGGVALLFGGPAAAPVAVLALLAPVGVFWLMRGMRRRSRAARRLALWLQVAILFIAAIDLSLAVILAQRGLELVPTLTRVVLPVAIFRLLRKPDVRAEFGVRPSRRQRRRLAREAA